MAPLARQEATIVNKWLCSLQEPTAALSDFFSTGSLSPACPSSHLLFTHRQLSQFPNAVIPSNILCSCFFVVFLLLSLSPSFLRVCCTGEEVEAGGGTERIRKTREGGYICSFMTNHMCFWVFVFTCFSWKREWWKGMTGVERQAYGPCLLS